LFGGGHGLHGFRTEPGEADFHYRSQYRARGDNHHAKILIDLEDAFHGAKRSLTLRVPDVDGQGHVQVRERVLNVRIPKGVKQGQHIRLAGQGSPGVGGEAAGDLILEVAFRQHVMYTIDGRDIYLDLPITPWEAALGGTVKTPTPQGAVDLKIPSGSASGQKMRLRGRGIPGSPPGDIYVVLQIAVPPANSNQAKAFYKRMAEELAFNPRQKLGV